MTNDRVLGKQKQLDYKGNEHATKTRTESQRLRRKESKKRLRRVVGRRNNHPNNSVGRKPADLDVMSDGSISVTKARFEANGSPD